jgi:hypothetical protein
MITSTARTILADALIHDGTLNALEIGRSRDGKRREWRLLIPTGGTLSDVTTAVVALTRWERGRRGGIVIDYHGYDGLAHLADALARELGRAIVPGVVH